jgi:hypothetical protein
MPAAPAPIVEYVFFPEPDQPVCYVWGPWAHIGTMDARGTFHVREKMHALKLSANTFSNDFRGPVTSFPEPVRVYEYRSGRLILGTMMPDGTFIPEVGSTVRAFDDYRYGREPAIWNLPGYFIRKDKAEEHQAYRNWIKTNTGYPAPGWEEKYLILKIKQKAERDARRGNQP